MSYDVYFSAANGLSFCIDDLETYFLGRPGYAYEKDEIIYRNDRTQVSFTFEFQNVNLATVGKLRFTLPYLRSKIYQREAELELAAFVKHFKPTVFDPQMHGMNSGPFDQKNSELAGSLAINLRMTLFLAIWAKKSLAKMIRRLLRATR